MDADRCAVTTLPSSSPPVRIEETWRLWQKFLDDYSRFEDWLKSAERTAACPNSSEVLYTNAKEELKRFEVSLSPSHSPPTSQACRRCHTTLGGPDAPNTAPALGPATSC